MKTSKKLLAVDIAECAVFVVLMIVSAFVKIPFPFMPLTFQTVISVFAGMALGAKKGVISMSVYCFMGLVGIPVFSSGGGFSYVLMPSFGYILGFIGGAFTAGLICGREGLPVWRYFVGGVAAFLVNYIVGVPYFILIWQFYLQRAELAYSVVQYNLIFMPKDLILSVLAALLAWRVSPFISRRKSVKKGIDNGGIIKG